MEVVSFQPSFRLQLACQSRPDDAVIDDPNKEGTALVWPTYGYLGATVRCFMPGAEG